MVKRLAWWFVTRFPWLGLTVYNERHVKRTVVDGFACYEAIPGSERWGICRNIVRPPLRSSDCDG